MSKIFLFSILSISTFKNFSYASEVHSKFFGTYIGITLGGPTTLTLEQRLTEITINKNGLHRKVKTESGAELQIHYGPHWLIDAQRSKPLKRWFPKLWKSIFTRYKFLATLQNPVPSSLAASIFNFDNKGQVLETLGEGSPIPLAYYVRKDSLEKWKISLQKFYEQILAELKENPPEDEGTTPSFLSPINIPNDLRILKSPELSLELKKDVINRAQHNLWTGTEEEIANRLTLLRTAIESKNPELILFTLQECLVGARVKSMIPMIESLIDPIFSGSIGFKAVQILEATIEALTVQLYDAHQQQVVFDQAIRLFGSTKSADELLKNGGNFSKEQADVLEKYRLEMKKPEIINYSLEDLKHIRSLLYTIRKRHKNARSVWPPTENMILGKINKALKSFPNPFECKTSLANLAGAHSSPHDVDR